LNRETIFRRDGYRCVYCGQVWLPDELTVDHVQPRVRQGDRSAGNLVTACKTCNLLKGHRRLSEFLAADLIVQENFFAYATFVWPRHIRALKEELDQIAALGVRKDGPG
jgi:5-methylcytosine-specific restriction endonuclease McrA